MTESRALPSRARAVIIGGGVIGTSVAYHLAEEGCTDVLLLEQGQLSCGTTWHAAGLVGLLRATESGTRLVQYSTDLYARLEEETGLSAGFRRCGGLIVARTPERLTQLRRTAAAAQAFGLQARMLTPGEAGERYPVMETGDLAGAIWLPDDGKANPADLTYALAKGARNRGVTIRERTRVTGILTEDGAGGRAVTGVRTPDLEVQAELVVGADGRRSAVRAASGLHLATAHSPIDVLWFRLNWRPGDPQELFAVIRKGLLMAMIYRGDYWQIAYLMPKGSNPRDGSLEAFKERAANMSAEAFAEQWLLFLAEVQDCV